MGIPKYHQLFNPLLDAMQRLGGSATIAEMEDEVIGSLGLSPADLAQPHGDHGTEVEYRLAWARTYLKAFGLLDNASRGVWVLTPVGKDCKHVHEQEVVRFVRSRSKTQQSREQPEGTATAPTILPAAVHIDTDVSEIVAETQQDQAWQDQLMGVLLTLAPNAFERLCQRLLRESGFTHVKVTGRSGDGGVDGVGLVELGGLLSFPVLFQCKRYRGAVGASEIRDFRGAMIGRADRGLVLTTGTFTRDARAEATRDGAPPIDLVDGARLIEKLKDLRLGVTIQMIEKVAVNRVWFDDI
jgi:restriction system protein